MSDLKPGFIEVRYDGVPNGRALAEQFLAEHERLKRELAETRAILADLLEERGLSWLARLAGRREELLEVIGVQCRCHDASPYDIRVHAQRCPVGDLLRIVGGPEERQRQVDAAHEAALSDDLRRMVATNPNPHPGPRLTIDDMNDAFRRRYAGRLVDAINLHTTRDDE